MPELYETPWGAVERARKSRRFDASRDNAMGTDAAWDRARRILADLGDAEQLARKAGRVGQNAARLWHNEEARSQRKLLYELHRQLDALQTRFPDVSG